MKKVCCVFGHRKVDNPEALEQEVYRLAERLVTEENVGSFLFGSRSEFDELCHRAVTALKEKFPTLQRIYVRGEYPYITDSYHNYLLKSYEDSYYPEKAINAGRASYVERNREMIDKSDFCIVYYRPDYLPPCEKPPNVQRYPTSPKAAPSWPLTMLQKKEKECLIYGKSEKSTLMGAFFHEYCRNPFCIS